MRKLRHFIALVLTVSLLCPVLIPIKVSAYHDTHRHSASTRLNAGRNTALYRAMEPLFVRMLGFPVEKLQPFFPESWILIHSAQKTMHSGTIRTSGNVYPSAFQFLKIELVFHGRMQ